MWCVLNMHHKPQTLKQMFNTVSAFYTHGFTVKCATCFVWDGSSGIPACMKCYNNKTFKSRSHCTVFYYGLGFSWCGRNTMYLVWPERGRVQRKEKKRTQRRLDCTIIMFLLNIWRSLKSESTVPSQYLDTKATIAIISIGAYTSGRIDTILK